MTETQAETLVWQPQAITTGYDKHPLIITDLHITVQYNVYIFTHFHFETYYNTVIVAFYCRIQRLPPGGGRGRIFSEEQEIAIVDMVIANNAIKLWEIWDRVLAVDITFLLEM